MENKQMYLLSYDHGGYILWGPHFAEEMQSAVDWMTRYPKFKIGLDNEAYCYDRYAKENPEIIEYIQKVQKQFKNRFSIGSSSYGQPLAVFINEESNIRQMTYAIRTNIKHFGVRPKVYAISEHAYHSQIPQLILQAEYEMALFRTHFQMYGYNPTYDSAFGTWYGEDGSGIPAIPTYEGQGAQFAATTVDNYILTRWPREWHESLEDFEAMFPTIEPLLASRYDDVVARCEELTQHVEEVAHYHWVTLDDLPSLYKDYQNNNNEYRPTANEFKVRMPWGYCGNKIFNETRKGEVLVSKAEKISTMASLMGYKMDASLVDNAWKNLMITQHHDIQICGLLREEKEFLSQCYQLSNQAKNDALDYIASKFKTNAEHNLMVVNASDKPITQQVVTNIHLTHATESYAFHAICDDECLPCGFDVTERTADGIACAYTIRFNATIPPFTVKVYSIQPYACESSDKSAQYENGVLTTEYYTITLGQGGIKKLIDKSTGNILIDNPGDGRLFAGVINDTPAESNGKWFVYCKQLITEALYQGEVGGIPCRFTLTIKDGSPLLDCHVEFIHNGEDIAYGRSFKEFRSNTNGFIHEEKLRFVMNIPFQNEVKGMRDRPFLIAETNDKYVEGNYWTYVGNNTLGMAVYNRGCMCIVREEDCLSIPLAYANSYVWGEKRLWGTYTHDFALRPLQEEINQCFVHKEALQYTYPLITKEIHKKQDGSCNNMLTPLTIKTPDNVFMSACYIENDQLLTRFYECNGSSGTISLKECRLTQVNLLGNEITPISGDTHTLSKHQICTLRIDK